MYFGLLLAIEVAGASKSSSKDGYIIETINTPNKHYERCSNPIEKLFYSNGLFFRNFLSQQFRALARCILYKSTFTRFRGRQVRKICANLSRLHV